MHSQLFCPFFDLEQAIKNSRFSIVAVKAQISLKSMFHLCKNHSILVITMFE